jgi:hypothetical protein
MTYKSVDTAENVNDTVEYQGTRVFARPEYASGKHIQDYQYTLTCNIKNTLYKANIYTSYNSDGILTATVLWPHHIFTKIIK